MIPLLLPIPTGMSLPIPRRAEALEFEEGKGIVLERRRPLARSPETKTFGELMAGGYLSALLNDALPVTPYVTIRDRQRPEWRSLRLLRLYTRSNVQLGAILPPMGIGRTLKQAWDQDEWDELQIVLWQLSGFDGVAAFPYFWDAALRESVRAKIARCGIAWCHHQKHQGWYVCRDRRHRLYCPFHQRAGWQARWRPPRVTKAS